MKDKERLEEIHTLMLKCMKLARDMDDVRIRTRLREKLDAADWCAWCAYRKAVLGARE